MIDIWLIFCLVVPFLEVILRTVIECVNCSCHICESEEHDKVNAGKEENRKEADLAQGGSSAAWVIAGAKVVPQQVHIYPEDLDHNPMSTGFDQGPGPGEDGGEPVDKGKSGGTCCC